MPALDDASPVEQLATRVASCWPGIMAARDCTDRLRQKLLDGLASAELDDGNCSVVLTGSLGRREASADSDADWILLIDGPSDPAHARMAREVDACVLECGFKGVGPTGTFGTMVASHSLVHHIAGIHDTNENLTRRMLLLSESWPASGEIVRERVLRNILSRYVLHDLSVQSASNERRLVPHFLLNDVVRYWRTIASDYASKMWERGGKGWATRNVKLRFSRKLLFSWGMIASFAGKLFPTTLVREQNLEEEILLSLLSELIREQTDVSPLDLLATVALHPDVGVETGRNIFSAYDFFLSKMSDPDARKHLDSLPFKQAHKDPLYNDLREKSRLFRDGLESLFFDEHPQLKVLVRQFGVF